MRHLSDHKTNAANEQLQITVVDDAGSGGASHHYCISGFDSATNPSDPWRKAHGQSAKHSNIVFQNGPIKEVGVNGITHEVLLAILVDRLSAFQQGPYACEENGKALDTLVGAQLWLRSRTDRRVHEGVEGTHALDKPQAAAS